MAHHKPASPAAVHQGHPVGLRVYSVLFGLFLGLCFLKFPNPPLLDHLSATPGNGWEWTLMSWPVRYAYPLVVLLALAGLPLMRWPGGVKWPFAVLPLAWLIWVWITAGFSIDSEMSRITSVHFTVGVVCFYLGFLVAGRLAQPGHLALGMVLPFLLVLMSGWEQHFGGLEASRAYFMTYVAPMQERVEPELLKRMENQRIFATLFYPNSLAGLLLMVTPVVLGWIAMARNSFTPGARIALLSVVGLAAGACMVWSGSKTGWLLALAMSGVVLMRLPIPRRIKLSVVAATLVVGGVAFGIKYHGFFERGATSVVARFDYWRAAVGNIQARPVTGSGPGTFMKVYETVRPPGAEMARLAHNDYLQQCSDSGLLGGALFLAMVGVVLRGALSVGRHGDWLTFGVALGVACFAAQSLVEFGFYVPATSWVWLGLSGWLVAQSGLKFDNLNPSS